MVVSSFNMAVWPLLLICKTTRMVCFAVSMKGVYDAPNPETWGTHVESVENSWGIAQTALSI